MSTDVAIVPPDTQALEVKSTDLVSRLAGLQIENVREVAPVVLVASLEGSALVARLADDYIREVESSLGPIVTAAHNAHKAAVKERDRLKGPAETLKRDAGLLGHACNAELKRREEEQRQQQERERQRLQKIADDEATAERARLQKIADDQRLAEAVQAEAAGDHGAAEKLIATPVVVPAMRAVAVFVPPPPKLTVETPGQSFGDTWGDFEVTDESLVPAGFWIRELDRRQIRAAIVSRHDKHGIPGIKAVPRPRTTLRSAR